MEVKTRFRISRNLSDKTICLLDRKTKQNPLKAVLELQESLPDKGVVVHCTTVQTGSIWKSRHKEMEVGLYGLFLGRNNPYVLQFFTSHLIRARFNVL